MVVQSYDVLKAKIIYGTHAAKPVKFEYRTVKRKEKPNCHARENFQVGYAMPIKPGTMQKQFVSSHSVGNCGYKKVRHIIAVPGTDIFELLDEMEMWDEPDWQEAEQITIVQPDNYL